MRPFTYAALALLAVHEAAVAAETMAITPGSSGTWNTQWQAVTGRAYFMQWSLDLQTWRNFPLLAYGTGTLSYGSTSNSDKFFIRLMYEDSKFEATRTAAENADYDGDGLSNLVEVQTHATSPLVWDTDGDLVGDSLEVSRGTSPITNTGAGDSDSDGTNNAEEHLAGRNPAVSDPVTDASIRQLDVFNLRPF